MENNNFKNNQVNQPNIGQADNKQMDNVPNFNQGPTHNQVQNYTQAPYQNHNLNQIGNYNTNFEQNSTSKQGQNNQHFYRNEFNTQNTQNNQGVQGRFDMYQTPQDSKISPMGYLSITLGILSLLACCFSRIVSIVLSITGLVIAIVITVRPREENSEYDDHDLGIISIIVNSIALLISVLTFIGLLINVEAIRHIIR